MSCGGCFKGAAGLAKYALGIGLAAGPLAEVRRRLCRNCERAVPCRTQPGKMCRCAVCGCWLMPKTGLAAETCPLEKW